MSIYIWGVASMLGFMQIAEGNFGAVVFLGIISFVALLAALPKMRGGHYAWGLAGSLAFMQYGEKNTIFAIILALISVGSLIYELTNEK